jgi:GNAT superfamily N-acetyltransferase
MNQTITTAELKADPLRIATMLRAPSGLYFTFRALLPTDSRILGEYFLGLSEQTKALYGPHPFDQATADKLCAEIDYADTIRFIGTLPGEGQEQVIAYFILMLGLTPGEMERYPKAGIAVDPNLDCLIAPSVADAYQSQGLGTPCMHHILSVARRLGRRYFLLMGGVYAHNERAFHFYQKVGFQMVAPFTPTWAGARPSYDMYVVL